MQSLGFQAAGGSNGGCSTSAGVSPRIMDLTAALVLVCICIGMLTSFFSRCHTGASSKSLIGQMSEEGH